MMAMTNTMTIALAIGIFALLGNWPLGAWAGISQYGVARTDNGRLSVNLTNFLHHRKKRMLIYEGGGTLKLVIGPTLPVNLGDPITWRSLICSYNLHGGHYAIIDQPFYPWDKWEDLFERKMRKMRDDIDRYADHREDDSRLFVYTLLERLMTKENIDGRTCLLRTICENAQVDHHMGIFAEVLNIILTPGKEQLNVAYKQAHEYGKSGVDCLQVYGGCPHGANFLDQYLEEF